MWATLVDKLLPTITWTLVHSLWQGLILTVLAGLVLLLTRRSSPALRYALLCAIFFLFIGGVCLTFFVEWNFALEPTKKYIEAVQPDFESILPIDQWRMSLALFLNRNAHWIVLAWALVLLFQSGRMVREIAYVRELRNRRTTMAGPYWKAKVQELAEELGIGKTVSLMESAVVRVPIVIGYLKPLVMVPVGMLNHLSPGEMEAVLLHELAHIRRHDYLVNYLQRIAETLLFFNPGMLWVSSLLRAEREVCCDEIAIARTGNKRQFVEALIRCKEHALQTPEFSLGLFGNRNQLLQRLNRIVSNRNQPLSILETTFFGVSILMLTIILSGWREGTRALTIASAPVTTSHYPIKEVAAQTLELPTQNENKHIAIRIKPASSESASKQTTQTRKQNTREVVSVIKKVDQRIHDLNSDAQRQHVLELEDLATEHNTQREDVEKRKAQVDLDRLQAEEDRRQAEIERAHAESHREQAERDREQANQYREKAQKDRLLAERKRVEAREIREQSNRRWQPGTVQ